MSHQCLSCRPGPDRVIDHERGVVSVPRGFRGPPDSVHGGAAAALAACIGDASLDGPTKRFNVRLHAPPPLETELPLRTIGGGERVRFEIGREDAPVLSGWAATVGESPVVPASTIEDLAGHATLTASERARWEAAASADDGSEEFAECFGCGTGNHDGLHLRTRPIDDHRSWVNWLPDERWLDGAEVSTLAAIAALDCTSAFPLKEQGITTADETCLLGTYDGEIHRRPPADIGDSFRIVTAPRERVGRKIYADIGLFAPDGEVFITGCATWIVLADT